MPGIGPGQRQSVIATTAHVHGDPAVEGSHAGIAMKSAQAAPAAVSVANATAAQQIGIGEEFVINLLGIADVKVAKLPVGYNLATRAGSNIYITRADNTLVLAATALTSNVLQAGYEKFGVLSEVDTTVGIAKINLNLKSQF